MLIIHAPSDALEYYKGGDFRDSDGHYYTYHAHPALWSPAPSSKLAESARQKHFERDPRMEPEMPVLSTVGSFNCEDVYPDKTNYTVSQAPIMQHDAIEILTSDVIADGHDVLEALRLHRITTVVLMGVHTNLCDRLRPNVEGHAGAASCVTLMAQVRYDAAIRNSKSREKRF